MGNFPGMGREEERKGGREQGGRIAELNHVGNWISYKNATLAVSVSLSSISSSPCGPPLPPTDIYAEEILLQSQSFLRYDSRSHTYGRRRPPSLPPLPSAIIQRVTLYNIIFS